eukprot:scaffold182749_cov20-Prasinocladus_malaysianus.AAC.1
MEAPGYTAANLGKGQRLSPMSVILHSMDAYVSTQSLPVLHEVYDDGQHQRLHHHLKGHFHDRKVQYNQHDFTSHVGL